jgi:cyclophilin family peptidyl-prolyl cis-trans isomerase
MNHNISSMHQKIAIFCAIALSLTTFTAQAKKADKRAIVQIETTMGNIRVALFDETPLHRDNFLKLVSGGFYDGILFHRVIRDFMIQAGDPKSKGAAPRDSVLGDGDLPYRIPAEIRTPDYFHRRGVLGMAREGDDVNPARESSACQFYIVWGKRQTQRSLADAEARVAKNTDETVHFSQEMRDEYLNTGGAPHLDGQYTVFGEVLEGLDVVDKIQKSQTDKNDRPLQDVRILRATVIQYPAQKATK